MENKGFCQCGCGQITSVIQSSCKKKGLIKGEHHKFILGHHMRVNKKTGEESVLWNGGKTHKHGYKYVFMPEHPRATKGGYVSESLLVAEKVLGKSLPKNAVIHHVNGDKGNNLPKNLVVCENNGYHHFIHRRQRALRACGHKNWLKCKYCKLHDEPQKMYVPSEGIGAYHVECKKVFNPEKR